MASTHRSHPGITNKLSGSARTHIKSSLHRPVLNSLFSFFASRAPSQLNHLTIQLRSCSNVNKGIFGGGGRVYLTYLQPERLSVNPPLQLIENGARSQIPAEVVLLSRMPCLSRVVQRNTVSPPSSAILHRTRSPLASLK